jgi:hypothetical protein
MTPSSQTGITAGPVAHVNSPARACATTGPSAALPPFSIPRRATGPRDVCMDILYCGVCHSDLHQVRNERKSAVTARQPIARRLSMGAGAYRLTL